MGESTAVTDGGCSSARQGPLGARPDSRSVKKSVGLDHGLFQTFLP